MHEKSVLRDTEDVFPVDFQVVYTFSLGAFSDPLDAGVAVAQFQTFADAQFARRNKITTIDRIDMVRRRDPQRLFDTVQVEFENSIANMPETSRNHLP